MDEIVFTHIVEFFFLIFLEVYGDAKLQQIPKCGEVCGDTKL